MTRRIAAAFAALIAASILVAPAAHSDDAPVARHSHAIVQPAPAPEPPLARHIDWD